MEEPIFDFSVIRLGFRRDFRLPRRGDDVNHAGDNAWMDCDGWKRVSGQWLPRLPLIPGRRPRLGDFLCVELCGNLSSDSSGDASRPLLLRSVPTCCACGSMPWARLTPLAVKICGGSVCGGTDFRLLSHSARVSA